MHFVFSNSEKFNYWNILMLLVFLLGSAIWKRKKKKKKGTTTDLMDAYLSFCFNQSKERGGVMQRWETGYWLSFPSWTEVEIQPKQEKEGKSLFHSLNTGKQH